ncbi:hypothetical protein [Streptomyces sp. NPDC007100]|uniref:hypothetical protein n=1 Tax=Streptomyces sp. NPDC007100 TaxID=3155602 RepID=UPI003411C406
MSEQGHGAAGVRWNDEAQCWDTGGPAPAPYTSPLPPKPGFVPDQGPVPPPPGAGAPPARRVAWSVPVVVGAAVAVVAAGFGGGWLLWGGDSGAVRAEDGRSSASASPGSPGPHKAPGTGDVPAGSATGGPSSGAPSGALPAGYRLVRDSAGFTLAVPETWQRSARKDGVFYTAPDQRYLLQIFEITEPDITPYEALKATSESLADKPGYVEMSLGPVGDVGVGTGATELVYAYDSDKLGVRARVTDRAFTVPDGRQFAVLVLGPDAEWPTQARIQRTALEHFAPRAS